MPPYIKAMRMWQRWADALRMSVPEVMQLVADDPLWRLGAIYAANTQDAYDHAPRIWREWPLNT